MILILDNYDSFVYNLARYCEELGEAVTVYRNDALGFDDIARLEPDAILLSPGPGRPEDAGIMIDLIKTFSSRLPILGICLGHQAIGHAFGAKVVRAKEPMHGRASMLVETSGPLFAGLTNAGKVGRYHSLIISDEDRPASLEVTARSERGEIMALKHATHPTYGLQFHPESILTDHGYAMLQNFLKTIQSR
ncbi:anthranilate synthase component 2 [Cohaesibacter sp. ES.047]|uniref:anthranilate synthase component II n=1 Tax=Cohaesibacter sp. ES.047 TaxID=1798205 RepID=UPI000BB6EC8A|nr:aminodeoxychorismate/anthranilate synthase component II [Cohaesibacter sp. ES.047]SNY93860.1 anthranilate synthase component 2 [Cohaesibacter sp. ES.047]